MRGWVRKWGRVSTAHTCASTHTHTHTHTHMWAPCDCRPGAPTPRTFKACTHGYPVGPRHISEYELDAARVVRFGAVNAAGCGASWMLGPQPHCSRRG